MARQRRAPKTQSAEPRLLPPVPGPKLAPFDTAGAPLDIQFLERLGTGGDSFVFRARINGREFAIKLFKFGVLRQGWGDKMETLVNEWSQDEHMYYMHPFYNECRVYGRLKETGNEHLSVKCFGCALLNASYKQQLAQQWGITDDDWEYDDDNYDWDDVEPPIPSYRSQKKDPIMAIIKELLDLKSHDLDNQPCVRPSEFPQIIRDVNSLHKLGVWVNDIEQRNFYKGRIFDFSRAHTAPHVFLDVEYIKYGQEHWWSSFENEEGFTWVSHVYGPVSDCFAVDRMIQQVERDTGQRIWVRMRPNFKYMRMLRRPPHEVPQHELWPTYRPELFDWRQNVEVTKTTAWDRRV